MGDIPSARRDGSSISPACYSRSDGMFINRLISEIGVRLRTIGGADSSIAIKHKSIISIWPLRACRTFSLRRSYPALYTHVPVYTWTHGLHPYVHVCIRARTQGGDRKEGQRQREKGRESRPNIHPPIDRAFFH